MGSIDKMQPSDSVLASGHMQLPVSCRQCVSCHMPWLWCSRPLAANVCTLVTTVSSPPGGMCVTQLLPLPTRCGLQQQLPTVETWQIRSVTHDASLKQSELPGIRRHLSSSISLTSLFEPTASYLYREGLGSCRTAWRVALPPSFHKSLYTASAHRSRQGLPFRP